jgi:hypothetical protein
LETLKSTIDSILPSIKFKTSRMHESDETIRWIPILPCLKSGGYMGITEDGDWAVEVASELHILKSPESYWRVEILLEQPFEKIHEEVGAFFKACNVSIDVESVFPFVEIIKAVLAVSPPYWMELTFKWYDQLSYENKRLLKDSLIRIVVSP